LILPLLLRASGFSITAGNRGFLSYQSLHVRRIKVGRIDHPFAAFIPELILKF
jgi:hypothetical protein